LDPPKFPRPEDSRLDCSRLACELDIEPAKFRTPFREALRASLQQTSVCSQRIPESVAQEGMVATRSTAPPQTECSLQGFIKTHEVEGFWGLWNTMYNGPKQFPEVFSQRSKFSL